MDNIREFPVKNDVQSPNNRIKKQARRHRAGRLYMVMLLLLLVGVVCAVYYVYEKSHAYESYERTSSIAYIQGSGQQTLALGENILTYGKDGANCVSASGKLLWNMTFEMQNPMVAVCGETASFADYGASTIFVHTKEGNEAEIPTNKPIRKISVSEKGIVAAVMDDVDITWIYLYDLNRREIAEFSTRMENSGYPVDVDISPTGELVAVSYYYIDGDEIRSSVSFHNFGEVGKNNIDNFVSGFNYSSSFVPLVRFNDDDSAYAISTGRISFYDGAHKPVSVAEMMIEDEVLSVYNNNDKTAVVYQNTSGNDKYRLEIYDHKGVAIVKKTFGFDYSGIALGTGEFVIYGDTNMIIDTYKGEKRFEGSYSNPIKLMIPTSDPAKFYIVTDSCMDTINFK